MRVIAYAVAALGVFAVAATQVPAHARLPIALVVAGAVVTQPFGCTTVDLEPFDAACPSRHVHTGIDLAAPEGTAVRSATAGIAVRGFEPAAAGLYVEVVVDPHVRILYCHLSSFAVVSGTSVSPGEVIGFVGATGLATGPHVHLQVDVDGVPVDPAIFLRS